MAKKKDVQIIMEKIQKKFRTFGAGRGSDINPLAEMLKDCPLQFALGVDAESVVRFVIREYRKLI